MKHIWILMLCALILTGCSGTIFNQQGISGSGKVVSEQRDVSGFSAVSLEGSGNVQIALGPNEAVTVEAENNLLPLIETVREKSVLVIRMKANTSIKPTKPIHYRVTMKKLDGVTILGSGNITAPEITGDTFTVALPGSGDITIGGMANQVNLSLGGSGNIYCDKLKAKTVTAALNGSGNITVYASESLDATIRGSGDIRYSGSPNKVRTSVPGSGTIHE